MAYNILIVDDSATTRAVIKRTIKLAEVPTENIYEASDGNAALEILACLSVDLVLADLNMPGMGGVEMTHNMRQLETTRALPVVIVTAEPNAQKLEQLRDADIQGYIRKPFTPEALRNIINQTLGVCHA
jgi:two-component system, chemotaxis family, chemotaxis protein CheY